MKGEASSDKSHEGTQEPPLLDPDLSPADPGVRYWLSQVTLRLRREIAWVRHQRGQDLPQFQPQPVLAHRHCPAPAMGAILPEKPSVTTTSTSPRLILSASIKPSNCNDSSLWP
mgnify:CR=1 FL=1